MMSLRWYIVKVGFIPMLSKNVFNESSKCSFTTIFEFFATAHFFLIAPLPLQPHLPPTSPARWACLLLAVLPGSMQVKNMNHPGLQAVLLGRLSVSTARMDEERQEGDETDSSSQPSSILPPSKPSVCSLLSLQSLPLESLSSTTPAPRAGRRLLLANWKQMRGDHVR